MSGKHTPGPWLLDANVVYALDDTKTVNRFSAQIHGGYVRRDTRGRGNDVRTPYPEIAANFRLIAAAPEMLEALKACAPFADGKGMVNGVNILAAIAKAEGKP